MLAKYQIVPVRSDQDLKDTIALFYQYAKWLDLNLNFQNFDAEMAAMPGKYAPPNGELFLARNNEGEPVGCVAVRPLDDGICEMKRLFVVDSAKGLGLGKALVSAVVEAGRKLGYRDMCLDTLPRMTAAINMYRSFGFVETPPYYVTPLPRTVFLKLDLTQLPQT
ncbi:hypothetical protein H2198_008180 [Neophaeococcomyces mojaviensis]|uniref:Uncharacterized protein n=1 Tax=Neophaeococcomyces mojaviensis TaxID=3383035 RepID=A0ACC2ZXT7_9EURO|nr:hypothetical protein H2198_008180 [Knufia sp. JES_112]